MIERYNQFVNKKRINEDLEPIETSLDSTEEDIVSTDLEGDIAITDGEEYYEEEDIYQTKLRELADMVGGEIIDNKVVVSEKEIIYPSETDMYHIDSRKFKTPEEVVRYLKTQNSIKKEKN
jgi:hypothetical protein